MRTDLPRILLVEEDGDDAFLTAHSLHRAGVKNPVLHARTVLEAKTKLRNCSDSGELYLIILSLDLPSSGGWELLEWLNETRNRHCAIVLAIGSSDRNYDIQKAFDLGANGYFAKRIDFDELASTLKRLELLPQPSNNENQARPKQTISTL